jgi:hypothetical protein
LVTEKLATVWVAWSTVMTVALASRGSDCGSPTALPNGLSCTPSVFTVTSVVQFQEPVPGIAKPFAEDSRGCATHLR